MTQFSGFSSVIVYDIAGNPQDIGPYVQSANLPEDFALVDVTALQTGGGQTTTKQVHGAVSSNVQITVYIDPTPRLISEQILGLRVGTLLQFKTGSNTSPNVGDKMFTGTFTLFSEEPTIESNSKDATMLWDFEPSDVGTTGTAPSWQNL